jgi:two-component system, chemotaxis family, CheB/CheR fusion protein
MSPITNNDNDLYIVAVGASAGGLEAIHEFFDNVPDSTNLSFIVIQHLSPDHKSLLVELVSKHTHMHVQEAKHQLQVQPGYVYVIPNDKILTIHNSKLVLKGKEQDKGPNLAIDFFLNALAEDQKEKAIAVILSGTGTDGTRGTRMVKEHGGLVLVQDPEQAKFDGMPRSVIAAQTADIVCAARDMADEIYNYIDGHSNIQNGSLSNGNSDLVSDILSTVHKNTNYDFHQYKPATIMRRISRRMLHTRKKHLKEYEQLVRSDHEEAKKLAREFFIGVTSFFRDKEAYEVLYNEVFPAMVENRSGNEAIKIWVTACSTGQEAYSIAILLDRYLQTHHKTIDVKIFASDIDASAIEIASRAQYPLSSVTGIDEDILNHYFVRHTNDYTIIPRIRKQIVFARHNILKDPPFIKNDLVSCRNLLIYLNPVLQQSVLSVLNFSLKKDGYLFLGTSENPSPIKTEISEVNSKWKIYKKHGTNFVFNRTVPGKLFDGKKTKAEVLPVKVNIGTQLSEDFKKILADELGYAAVYLNENYEIKEVAGDFRRYLSLPDKILNLNLLRMVPVELSGILSTAFRKVLKEKLPTSLKNVRVTGNGTQRIFNIVIKPPQETSSQQYLLVLFGEVLDAAVRPATGINDISLLHQNSYIHELEDELKETRANLQMAIEGLETTNEELHSSNEELQSANEELQSSNEELQSLNEELHTLNTEHQMRIKELQELNDDLNNYFRSAEIAQIFLDSNLRIRKYNPAAVEVVNIIETDIGRPFTHISNNLKATELNTAIEKVLQTNTILEKEIELDNGKMCLMRILPYVRLDKKTDGVVITFVDVSIIRNLNDVVKGVFDTSASGIIVFESVRDDGKRIKDFSIKAANNAVRNILNVNRDDYAGLSLQQHFAMLRSNGLFNKYVEIVEKGRPFFTEISFEKDNKTVWYTIVANKLSDGLILTLTDITDRKEAEERLRSQYNEILKTKESLKQLNAELELKVKERTFDLSQSEERFRQVASITSDAIWDWSLAENKVWWSDSFYTRFGYQKEDPEIHSASFWFDNIHPSDKQRVREGINHAIEGKEDWNSSYRFRKNNGEYATILDRGIVMRDESGIPYRMLGSMEDISKTEQISLQLKTKNDQLQSLIQEFTFVTDFMPQMVWATQPDGYHDFFNKGWYDFTGLNYEQTKDKGWSLVLHPDDYARTWKEWDACLRTGKHYAIEYRMRRYDGEYRWFLARAIPLKDNEGKIIKWFGTCTDIHDQKMETDILEQKIEERTYELKRINTELENSNDELMQFASVASHDLQEPLRKIHIFSHLIKERFLSEDSGATDYINRIIKSSSRATNLINDLLSFSRLSGESLFKRTDLNEIVNEVLGDVELAIIEKKARVKIETLPVIEAVPGQMRQIFQNMITNALKFTRKDTIPEIRIKAEQVASLSFNAKKSETGDFYRISISDNGIGFDPQYLNKIFTIFQRLHPREKYEGTGIGLAITKKIVEKHNGVITAESREGEGAEFILVLPAKQPEAH